MYQINDTLWEGSYYPRLPNSKRKKFNVYAKTREECEKLLAEMIKEKRDYPKAEYLNNVEYFEEYYDEIEICQASAKAHFKGAIQIRNREMVDRADLIVCCIDHEYGGAYQTIQYAQKQNKKIINLATEEIE